jgi:hypothetical protein
VATAKKRAPPKKKAAPKPLTPWQKWTARQDAIEDLCDRIQGGDSLTGIAASLGAHVANLTRWIAADPQRSARAREARIAAAGTFDEMALDELRSAADPFELARAREVASHLRWKASKADPGRYGDKLDVTADIGIKALPDDQLMKRANELAAKLGIVLTTTGSVPSPKSAV